MKFHWLCTTCGSRLGPDDVDLHNSPDGVQFCCPQDVGASTHLGPSPLVVMVGPVPGS